MCSSKLYWIMYESDDIPIFEVVLYLYLNFL